MLIQPFIENSINHGLFNLPYKGALILEIIRQQETLTIVIDDNGIGRKEAQQNMVVKNKHISRGMELVSERIQALNYIENIEINIEIIDKVNNAKQPEGTKIIMTIP
ncbi:MAG: hypothetical protein HY738_13200 [Bacteroidia bacterium]|nr:hypothetical protein [Bacteroidia bacterium]